MQADPRGGACSSSQGRAKSSFCRCTELGEGWTWDPDDLWISTSYFLGLGFPKCGFPKSTVSLPAENLLDNANYQVLTHRTHMGVGDNPRYYSKPSGWVLLHEGLRTTV